MDTNWSLIINITLLISVIFILIHTLRKKQDAILPMDSKKPALSVSGASDDDIIAVRKIGLTDEDVNSRLDLDPTHNSESDNSKPSLSSTHNHEAENKHVNRTIYSQQLDFRRGANERGEGVNSGLSLGPTNDLDDERVNSRLGLGPTNNHYDERVLSKAKNSSTKSIMLFLLAKAGRHLAGYEMLQAISEAGLRLGDDQLFHYYEPIPGGQVLFSLAAATKNGTFDMQNIGAFNAKGLCLFMYQLGDLSNDAIKLKKMMDVAQQLAEGLDALLLDDARKPFTHETNDKYYEKLQSHETKIFS